MKTAAIIGIAALAFHGFMYTTENAVILDPVHETNEKEQAFPQPPVVGVVAMLGGVLLILQNRKKAAPPRP